MRLLRAELLKLRRRQATYVVLIVLLAFMALFYVLAGLAASTSGDGPGPSLGLRFPRAYAVINQFVFGLGSLLAVAYAAAVAGADWNWSTIRVAIARGESRSRYVVMKYLALALMIAVGAFIAYGVGMLLTVLGASLAGTPVGSPFSAAGLADLRDSYLLGTFAVLEQASIGFALAMLARSQLAGIVMGLVLYFGEPILSLLLNAIGRATGGQGSAEFLQYGPFSASGAVLLAAPSVTDRAGPGDILPRLDMPEAAVVTGIYLVLAVAISALAVERAELTG